MAVDGAYDQQCPPMRDNFPLPRELRDMIYSYLLCHEYVMAPPFYTRDPTACSERNEHSLRRISIAHTFQFHVNILCVNHEIGAEASKALALNHFAVVSALWKFLDISKHFCDLPIVSEDTQAIAKFTHHHLHVHVGKPTPPHTLLSFIIVGAALPMFCEVIMPWAFATERIPTRYLSDKVPGRQVGLVLPAALCIKAEAVYTKVEFLSPAAMPMTTRLEARLLVPFASMITRLHDVTIVGSTQSPQRIAALQARMGPLFVSITPFLRQLSDLLSALKPTADRLMAARLFGHALTRYRVLELGARFPLLTMLPEELVSHESRVTMVILLQKFMDITLTKGFLHLHANDIEKAAESLAKSSTMEGSLVALLPAGMIDRPGPRDTIDYHRGSLWLTVLTSFARSRDLSTVAQVAGRLQELASDMGVSSMVSAVRHDASVIADAVARPQHLDEEADPQTVSESLVSLLSVRHFQLPVIDTPVPHGWIVPARCDGMIEPAHMQALRAMGLV
ncbi:hypothetical protein LTR53_000328 [Teratosphaeriaceae sp. CCFEE 6253]|nr:hypothetical protein LTR53_000328 [Teratosphaeriaceae sp. CCFEE 6253]